jgi:hypothetical protein
MVSDSMDIRVRRPVVRDNKKETITILKSHADDEKEERTIKRTIKGEKAALQVKWIKHPNEVEFVHVHCESDKESTAWGKASEVPIEKFYVVTQLGTSEWEIICKKCGRKWSTASSQAK